MSAGNQLFGALSCSQNVMTLFPIAELIYYYLIICDSIQLLYSRCRDDTLNLFLNWRRADSLDPLGSLSVT